LHPFRSAAARRGNLRLDHVFAPLAEVFVPLGEKKSSDRQRGAQIDQSAEAGLAPGFPPGTGRWPSWVHGIFSASNRSEGALTGIINQATLLEASGSSAVTDWSRKQEIQQAGITAVPGPGFDVVPTDCLAGYVASNLERPVSLVIALRGLDSASQSTCAPRFAKFPNLYCAGGKEQLLPSEAGGWCSPWASRESQAGSSSADNYGCVGGRLR